MNRNTNASKPSKPRPRPARTAELLLRPEPRGAGAVTITVGKVERTYLVTPLPSDFGRAFRLERLDADGDAPAYDVCLDGERATCECKGFLYRGRCKHVETLRELAAAGKL